MADTLRFPLYFFRALGTSNVVFTEHEGEKRLPLFSSVENADRYRKSEALNVRIARLRTASELRELLLGERDDSDFKIEMDPTYVLTI
jgi:hypothetical protein